MQVGLLFESLGINGLKGKTSDIVTEFIMINITLQYFAPACEEL